MTGTAKPRGVASEGMIFSETELELGEGADGIMVLEDGIAAPGTPVSDVYGMAEANWAAFECPHGNYHIPPWVYAVVTDDADRIIPAAQATGLLAFFDPVGGGDLIPPFFQTADHVHLVNGGAAHDPAFVCPCGLDTAYVAGRVQRVDLMEEAGCAAQI